MDGRKLVTGKCYRLVTGRIVRFVRMKDGVPHCHLFSTTQWRWIEVLMAAPSMLFLEACDDPLGQSNAESPIDPEGIFPGHCYRLQSGRIVRVLIIEDGVAKCELFSESRNSWIKSNGRFPASTFVALCPDPQQPSPEGGC
jgi:hypothetical protein